ncbi:hypothetical protein WJX73_006242 [Symbiochloris irregularis]|uniref:Dol-P-Glc:Glc(2)Man(9)GlcNAc(2)-PP-Dol alpha-1,2-glucosyltransferase n=1 Tax=Symbiochloris irregularis TaxID=706552 RepID=A0AAW1NMC3_9CHLO
MPPAYMDEVFHVRQTQQYCKGDFASWDPKITTFPGLYITGASHAALIYGALKPFRDLSLEEVCHTTLLRTVNVLLAAACYLIICNIYRKLHPQVTTSYAMLMAVTLTLFPLHFFFIFFYYTDVGSLTFTMAGYLAALHKRSFLAAALAGASVLFRQTNAVWAVFILVAAVSQRCFRQERAKWRDAPLETQIVQLIKYCWQHKGGLLLEVGPLASVPLAFAAFVVWNGGVVVGDKGNHQASPHLMQPLYFVLFCALALYPIFWNPRKLTQGAQKMLRSFQSKPITLIRLLATATILAHYVVEKYTIVHPFLLADNRHYTFYLWKKVLSAHPLAPHMLVPAYLYSGWSLWEGLRTSKQLSLLVAAGMICTIAVLVPAPLIEFRYFTIPFVMLVLHMKPPVPGQLYVTAALWALVNAVTLYEFLFAPYTFADGSRPRLMW